jgi:hypothetical protein
MIPFRLAAEAATLVQTVVPAAAAAHGAERQPAVRDGSLLVVLTRPGRRFFAPDVVKSVGGLGEELAFYPYGLPSDPAPGYDDDEGTDFAALRSGCISVSLLAAGAADEASAERQSWFRGAFDVPHGVR